MQTFSVGSITLITKRKLYYSREPYSWGYVCKNVTKTKTITRPSSFAKEEGPPLLCFLALVFCFYYGDNVKLHC